MSKNSSAAGIRFQSESGEKVAKTIQKYSFKRIYNFLIPDIHISLTKIELHKISIINIVVSTCTIHTLHTLAFLAILASEPRVCNTLASKNNNK